MRTFYILLTCLLLIFTSQGCASKATTEFFLREQVDLGYIKQIAILPFENNSKDNYAPSRARELAITQVLSQRIFDVVDKGQVDSALREEAIEPGHALDELTIKRLGQRLNVQAFLLGSVDQTGEQRLGASSFTELSLTLRLIDSKTALVLWQASGYGSGYSMVDRLFGLNPKDAFEVTMTLVDRLLSSIPRSYNQAGAR
ncbi:MAG: penicillin-binding protein activator LpoB [Desulfobulbaceae bacterium]|nr:penicillin-binding protein activator LpoB [Desulfobulbaceae bacterium]